MKKSLLLASLLLSGFFLTACSSSSSSTSSASSAETTVAETTTEAMTVANSYKVGDKIVFDGVAEITIVAAEWTDERNQFESSFVETSPEKVLKVTYNVTNLSDKDYVLGSGMDLYVGGKKMETYPNSNTIDTVSAGRAFDGAVQHFGVIGTGGLELEVEPSFSFGTEKPALVTLDLQ